ncbi:50S ribosomal protein L21 [Candidatus Curtissbacteria bacterium RIFCSPLOWO2_01_FULL_37_9]|uniref:Large ribosomal subunit protein bL21 n=1 Tax=Candidatus Curtissbacteria bacterium RIFCSPLOWO2_01_FULL_37_9 TaxID=1797724 RepID=A0A1F5GTX4_9BACT|nr:MAG: 50S ribosomal protein L21 [Candidatus Curtissbacteria bacterium RIFCSPLOWO2_01_FULL_37_9]
MLNWAVFKTGGKQYKASEGDLLLVDNNSAYTDEKIIFDDVLIVRDDKNVKIGNPKVEKFKVIAKNLGLVKDKKVRVVKFKSKSRYTRTYGHRQKYIKVLIEKIQSQ